MALNLNLSIYAACDLRLTPTFNGIYSQCAAEAVGTLSTNLPGGETIGNITINDNTITVTNLTFDGNPVTFPYTVNFSTPTVFGFIISPSATPGNVDQFKITFNLVSPGAYSFTYDMTELDIQNSITIPNNTLPLDFGNIPVGSSSPGVSFVVNNETSFKYNYSWDFPTYGDMVFDTGSATINPRSTYTETAYWVPTFARSLMGEKIVIYTDCEPSGSVFYATEGNSFYITHYGLINAGYLVNTNTYNAVSDTTGNVALELLIPGLIPSGFSYTIYDIIFTPSSQVTISNASLNGTPLASSFPFVVDNITQQVLDFDISVLSGLVGESLGITLFIDNVYFDTTTVFINTLDIEIINDGANTITEFDFGAVPIGGYAYSDVVVGVPPYPFIYEMTIDATPLSAPFNNNLGGGISIGGGTGNIAPIFGTVDFNPTVVGSFSQTQSFDIGVKKGTLSTYSNPIYTRSIPVLGTATPPPPVGGASSNKLVIANSISI